MMYWLLTNIVSSLLLPPANLLIVMWIGWRYLPGSPRLGRALLFGATLLLAALSTPLAGNALLNLLQTAPALDIDHLPHADAIVVLSGGTYDNAPEYGGDTVRAFTLERARYGAKLHRITNLPVLVSGGRPDKPGQTGEARLLKSVLETEFLVPVRWVEDRSSNTADNARYSAAILKRSGVRNILLVTHAWHMPRAQAAFEANGLSVTPAPTVFVGSGSTLSVFDFIPSAPGLTKSYYAMHEAIGLIWYRLHGDT